MSVSGIFSSDLSIYSNQNAQNNRQQFRKEFEQLGQDLQSGNLSAAQADFVSLQQLGPQGTSTSAQGNSPLAQAFNQLAQDLQSGNLSAAQQDFANIQKTFQSHSEQTHRHHHHHQGGGNNSEVSQLFSQLGQALQSGDLSGAQQAYNSLMQAFGKGSGQSSTPSATQSATQQPATNGVSVNA